MAPVVHLGWVLAADERDHTVLQAYDLAHQRLLTVVEAQFPQFSWVLETVTHRTFVAQGALDPLPLLELGVQEKISNGWDYALVVVPNELTPRARAFVLAVPSSALEVAVVSSARMTGAEDFADRLAGLALHQLGHLWGLNHAADGPMALPEDDNIFRAGPFPAAQAAIVVIRLSKASDSRLEEQHGQWNWVSFHLHTVLAAPRSIMRDIWGAAPWLLPLRMGRLTAAAAVSIVFLLLGAEAWEVGINFTPLHLIIGACGIVVGATSFMYWGQNLSQISRHSGWNEQLTRTRVVLFTTLLVGMGALWLVIFVVALCAAAALPRAVPTGWVGEPLGVGAFARYAAFLAIIGVAAGALGGNLEDTDTLKAHLYFDEET